MQQPLTDPDTHPLHVPTCTTPSGGTIPTEVRSVAGSNSFFVSTPTCIKSEAAPIVSLQSLESPAMQLVQFPSAMQSLQPTSQSLQFPSASQSLQLTSVMSVSISDTVSITITSAYITATSACIHAIDISKATRCTNKVFTSMQNQLQQP